MKYAFLAIGVCLGYVLGMMAVDAWAAVATPQGETSLTIQPGDWGNWALGLGITALSAVWASVKGLLPGPARWAIELTQLDQVIFRSIQQWAAKQEGNIRDKTWTVDLKFQAARDIAVLALNTGNKFATKYKESLEAKALARLQDYLDRAN